MKATRHHLVSLDVFRGLTIAAMIAVNNPGNWSAVFPALTHSYWDGCTPADLVFPAFLVIMGVAMPFAFDRRLTQGDRRQLERRVLRRTAILILLGLLLNLADIWPNVSAVRIPGVLQRIALVYLGTAWIVLHGRKERQLPLALLLLVGHWFLLLLVPFDGASAGMITPTQNLGAALDRSVFGAHMLKPTGDPEGLLGLFPSIATALLGVIAGRRLRAAPRATQAAAELALGGVALAALGLGWSLLLPFNKSLWTGSYALWAVGVSLLGLAACHLVVEAWRVQAWARPFVWLGVNPLAIYFGSEIVGGAIERPLLLAGTGRLGVKDVLYWRYMAPLDRSVSGATSSLVFALCYLGVWVAVGGLLHRRGLRVQV